MEIVHQTRRRYSGQLKEIRVLSIDPQTYPQFCRDKEHPFIDMPDEQRVKEVVSICASVLVQQVLSVESPVAPVLSAAA